MVTTVPTAPDAPAQTAALVPTPKRAPRVRKAQPVYVLFVIDASGSMFPRAADVRGGFNEYVGQLRADTASTYKIAVQTFNTTTQTLFGARTLAYVPVLDETNYTTGGNTALYDALGESIDLLTVAVKTKVKPYGTARCLVIVMTDGEENSSRRCTKEQIAGKIARREAAGNWTFVYLGADLNAWGAASSLGFAPGNVAAYAGTSTRSAMSALAATTASYSTGHPMASRSFAAMASSTAAGRSAGMTPAAPASAMPEPSQTPHPASPWQKPARRRTPKAKV